MRSDVATSTPVVETIESGPRTIEANKETVVVARIGDATAWDVSVDVDGTWVQSTVTMKVYGRAGGERRLLSTLLLSNAGTVGVALNKAICSIRGTPVTAIEVTITSTANKSGGKFTLRSWVGNEPPIITTGSSPDVTPTFVVRQGAAALQPARWPFYLSDGTNEIGTGKRPLITRATRPGRTYSATTGVTTTATNPGNIATHAALWSTSSHAFDAEILRVTISYASGAGADLTFRAAAFGTAPSGGTSVSPAPWDGNDTPDVNMCTLYGGGTVGDRKTADLFGAVVHASSTGTIVWEPSTAGQPLLLPKGVARGVEIRSVIGSSSELTTAVKVVVSVQWIEMP